MHSYPPHMHPEPAGHVMMPMNMRPAMPMYVTPPYSPPHEYPQGGVPFHGGPPQLFGTPPLSPQDSLGSRGVPFAAGSLPPPPPAPPPGSPPNNQARPPRPQQKSTARQLSEDLARDMNQFKRISTMLGVSPSWLTLHDILVQSCHRQQKAMHHCNMAWMRATAR